MFAQRRQLMAAAIALALSGPTWGQSSATATTLPEVSVTGTREGVLLTETPASVGIIKGGTVELDHPTHPSQIISQVPGAAVAVTNGEGHTTAIRQPFTTNPVYLFLEDGIPIRSTGFFNHNGLYEINIPQSGGIEITRGPGTALYGSDAVGGVINVLTRTPPAKREISLSGELGSFGWRRALVSGGSTSGDDAWRADLNLTHTDGWRDTTAYDRQSGTLRWDRAIGADATLKTVLAFSEIDQETGANAPLIYEDYQDNPTKNNFPIAFRKVSAMRLSSSYEKEIGASLLSITPYVRDDSMNLLASFSLSFDPTVYTVENQSLGLMAKWRTDFPGATRARLIAGADIDVSPGGRKEDSLKVTTSGSGASRLFSAYTTGPRVYDYDVSFKGISPYVHGEISPSERVRLSGGLRYDHLSYDFSNHLSGSVSSGTRVYGQSADGSVSFNHVSPKLGATYALAADTHLFAAYNHGFRAPSEGQLFRPSSASNAAAADALVQAARDLQPIKADQFEVGVKGQFGTAVNYDLSLYNLEKRDDILTFRNTSTNFTQAVNAGKTSHRGVELGAGMQLAPKFRVDVAYSYAVHRYTDWNTSGGDFSGKEIESAPRILANTRLTWTPIKDARIQLEWVSIGSYWMNAANTVKYPGHDLFNLRGNWPISRDVSAFGSINNLLDERYADSASISSNTPVYSPGLTRALFLGLEAKW
ncbi:MAG: TonB-dependent receptor [Burkholderiales bacterium]|nr:TonB-dependent receptor [Burkholderiales bacterium]